MAEIKMVSCCTCGYEWRQGCDGSHHCSAHMAKTIARQAVEIERLKARLTDSGCDLQALYASPEPAAWRIQQGARVYIISNAEFVRSSFDAASMTPLYDKPQPAAEPAKAEPGEWIEWAGGECPIAGDVRPALRFKNGEETESSFGASTWNWFWMDGCGGFDIVAYRVMP